MATATKAAKVDAPYQARLRHAYNDTYVTELEKDLELKNVNQVPRLEKIVVNVGLGKAKDDKKVIETANNTLTKITGQKPVQTYAKNSIAGFKLREGNMIGLKVTLRGDQMYEFMDRLINIVLPRLRDFHGVSNKAFDRQGNYSLGFIDQSVFPELTFDETTTTHGLQMTFVINSHEQAHSRALLENLACRSRRRTSNMAKKSIVARDAKRQKMIEKYAAKRAELKELGDLEGLAKLPRNSSPTRWKNRCVETGRPHAYMRQFRPESYQLP